MGEAGYLPVAKATAVLSKVLDRVKVRVDW